MSARPALNLVVNTVSGLGFRTTINSQIFPLYKTVILSKPALKLHWTARCVCSWQSCTPAPYLYKCILCSVFARGKERLTLSLVFPKQRNAAILQGEVVQCPVMVPYHAAWVTSKQWAWIGGNSVSNLDHCPLEPPANSSHLKTMALYRNLWMSFGKGSFGGSTLLSAY